MVHKKRRCAWIFFAAKKQSVCSPGLSVQLLEFWDISLKDTSYGFISIICTAKSFVTLNSRPSLVYKHKPDDDGIFVCESKVNHILVIRPGTAEESVARSAQELTNAESVYMKICPHLVKWNLGWGVMLKTRFFAAKVELQDSCWIKINAQCRYLYKNLGFLIGAS